MGLRDKLEDMLASFRPKSRGLGGGIGSGHGMVASDDVSCELWILLLWSSSVGELVMLFLMPKDYHGFCASETSRI